MDAVYPEKELFTKTFEMAKILSEKDRVTYTKIKQGSYYGVFHMNRKNHIDNIHFVFIGWILNKDFYRKIADDI